jgi:hypothetical protein
LALSSAAFVAEPDAVIASAGPLIDALEALTLIDDVAVSPAYIPGYGLQLNAAGVQSDLAAGEVAYPMQDIVSALRGTISGLEPGDWVSASLRYDYTPGGEINITVRVKPDEFSPPEMWMGGMLFNSPVEPCTQKSLCATSGL